MWLCLHHETASNLISFLIGFPQLSKNIVIPQTITNNFTDSAIFYILTYCLKLTVSKQKHPLSSFCFISLLLILYYVTCTVIFIYYIVDIILCSTIIGSISLTIVGIIQNKK